VRKLTNPKSLRLSKVSCKAVIRCIVCACEIIFLHLKESSRNSGANRTTTNGTRQFVAE
jgi:hypothetical protein